MATEAAVEQTATGPYIHAFSLNSIIKEYLPKRELMTRPDDDAVCRWTKEASYALIEEYKLHKDEMADAHLRKHQVWQIIAGEMRDKGFQCNAYSCHRKFRNLKNQYKGLKDHVKKNGYNKPITWEYFHAMADVFGEDADAFLAAAAASGPSQQSPKSQAPTSSSTPNLTQSLPVMKAPHGVSPTMLVRVERPQPPPTPTALDTDHSYQKEPEPEPGSPYYCLDDEDSASNMSVELLPPPKRKQTPGRGRKRKGEEEAPRWFMEFAQKQARSLAKLIELEEKNMQIQKERNELLRQMNEIESQKLKARLQ